MQMTNDIQPNSEPSAGGSSKPPVIGSARLRQQIDVTKRNLQFAENCDWAGQIIYCKMLLNDYENKLMDIIFAGR
jgi:hypothetical protein